MDATDAPREFGTRIVHAASGDTGLFWILARARCRVSSGTAAWHCITRHG